MEARLERILNKLAHHYIAALLSRARGDSRLRMLADGLAREGVLVIAGHVPGHVTTQQVINDWVRAYHDLHQLLTGRLFPTHTGLKITDADGQHPPVFVLYSDVCAVTKAIGGYVVPFVAGQQQQGQVYQSPHLKGIMTYLINDLEGGDLSASESNRLAEDGVPILQRLLNSVVQQEALTSPNQEVAPFIPAKPPPPPPTLPENGQHRQTFDNPNGSSNPHTQHTQGRVNIQDEPPPKRTDTKDMFVPIFFKRPKKKRSSRNRRTGKRDTD
jgi:hypothetical protein